MAPRPRLALLPLLCLASAAAAAALDGGAAGSGWPPLSPELPPRRFLVPLSMGGQSPSADALAVAAALARRGHAVDVAVPTADVAFSRWAAARHVEGGDGLLGWVVYEMPFSATSDTVKAEVQQLAANTGTRSLVLALRGVLRRNARACGAMLRNATLMRGLAASNYSAVITFKTPGDGADGCGCAVAHALRVPELMLHADRFLSAPLSVPQFFSGLSREDLRTFRGRLLNAAAFASSALFLATLDHIGAAAMAPVRAASGLPRGPAAAGCGCAPLLQLCTNSWLLEEPRPLAPNQALIGPIAPRPPRPITEPAEVAAFLEGATSGFLLVSFGSIPTLSLFLTRRDFGQLAAAFAALAPLRVLWLLKGSLPGGLTAGELELELGANTLAAPWVDLNDALGHPRLAAAMLHGGAHSVDEAAFHGKPVVGIPFQGEQRANLLRLAALGMAEVSPEAPATRPPGGGFTAAGVEALVRKVTETPSYAAAARRVAAAARGRAALRPPLRAAVEEVELALLAARPPFGGWRPYSCGAWRGGDGDDAGAAADGGGGREEL